MELVIPGAFFILGAIIASFVGVIVARLRTGQSFLTGRSHCDACNAELMPVSLIPIISFFMSKGRARCCKTRLSPISPLSEALLGTLFVMAYATLGFSTALLWMLLALSVLLTLVSYDLVHQILPFPLLGVFIVASILFNLSVVSTADLPRILLTAFLIAMSLVTIHVLSRGRAMGFADAPLVFGLALLVGPAALPGFIFSFWIGAVVGILLLARRPAGSRMGVEVPFAPFLAAGFLLAYFTQWNPFMLLAASL